MKWFIVRIYIPILLFVSAWLSSWLWESSPWWAGLTAFCLASGISYSVFCGWWDPDRCDVVHHEVISV